MCIFAINPYTAPPALLHVRLTKYTVAPFVMLSEELDCRYTAVPNASIEEGIPVILSVKFTFPVIITILETAVIIVVVYTTEICYYSQLSYHQKNS